MNCVSDNVIPLTYNPEAVYECRVNTYLDIQNGGPPLTGSTDAFGILYNREGFFTISSGTGDFVDASGTIAITNFYLTGEILTFNAEVKPCLPLSPPPSPTVPSPTRPTPTPPSPTRPSRPTRIRFPKKA